MNRDKFFAEYAKQLIICCEKYPDEYAYTIHTGLEIVTERMKKAFLTGTFNKDGRAIKATCKVLGINYTYKAILDYLEVNMVGN